MNGASESESTFEDGETAGAENNWTDDDIELFLTVCVVMVVLLASTLFLLGRSRRNITNRNNSNTGHRMRQVHDEHNMMGFVGGGGVSERRIQVNTSVEGIAGFKEEGKDPEFARIGMKVVSAICSRLLVSESRVGKGTVVVVSFTPRDLMNKPDCSVGLVKALACCYNLVCVLRLPDETTSYKTMSKDDQAVIDDMIRTFRSYGITEEMIGSHKILACRSAVGKVAIIRQLGTPKLVPLVIDFETEVNSQLSRFGFTVFNYKSNPAIPELSDIFEFAVSGQACADTSSNMEHTRETVQMMK